MPLITKADLRTPEIERELRKRVPITKSASQVLVENAQVSSSDQFDVFLSHSYKEAQTLGAEDLLRLKALLESHGLTVYVDWIVDGQLSREKLDTDTAKIIRRRMDQSKCLLFATSATSSNSKWMPWELGYKDGASNRAAILPIIDYRSEKFYGQEYLGLYPYVTRERDSHGEIKLWIENSDGKYVSFNSWLQTGAQPTRDAS